MHTFSNLCPPPKWRTLTYSIWTPINDKAYEFIIACMMYMHLENITFINQLASDISVRNT